MFTKPSHIRRYLALLPVEILAGMPVFLYLFAAFVPPHRCRVQQCDDGDEPRPPLVNETWTDIAIPKVRVARWQNLIPSFSWIVRSGAIVLQA